RIARQIILVHFLFWCNAGRGTRRSTPRPHEFHAELSESSLRMNGIILTGASGRGYFYTPYPWATHWRPDPANYAFAFQDESGDWRIVYVGETASLTHRMRGHGQWVAAQKLGCSHVLVNLNAGGMRARRLEEQDLIAKYQPVLNSQHLKPSRA